LRYAVGPSIRFRVHDLKVNSKALVENGKEQRFIKVNEQLSVFAIVDFGEDPRPAAQQPFDAGAVMRGLFRFQIAVAEKTKHLLKIRKLIIASGGRADLPFIVDCPRKRSRGEKFVSRVTLLCSRRTPPVKATRRFSSRQLSWM
jgi:hypothetical protein